MSVTIKDVAKQANVAPSTVSRVLTDSPRISEKTKRKVRKVMEEMGYHLNFSGRMLVQQSTQTIGVVMKGSSSHSFDNPFFSDVLRGISASCHKHDYSINITTGDSEDAIYRDVIKMVQGKRVDGVIVLYSKEDDQVVPYLRERNFPFVMIGKPTADAKDIIYVDNDNVQASKEVAEFLINLGHEKIGYIGGDTHFEVTTARLTGFQQAVAAYGIDIPDRFYKNIQLNSGDAKKAVGELLSVDEPPTALIVTDDFNALTVMLALQEQGIRIPEEMSVISFNNTIISRLANPPLTTVDTQPYQLGYESADCLVAQLGSDKMFKKSVIVPTVIVERDSCMTRK
ncbi:LacI family transcriptional regulator [Thalassobacillus devorans]|uniref:LacI family transcriptional regulator n=1 Tax=Thalassobacillus devorans TaxID=279813 RepID=A0ABQ1NUN8_9BACI|nr:LacI family DNA-binding transcriptional regulator [Thalassobacillus devorans]NIK28808.1 DNA-binding LacI/PurR family transcriptional regulator [Thalassobacillus devorans]GGC83374.1 LacI family transcriptional regulator [Thalassobacillus devorans]